jgi:hypothetical protein
VDRTTTTPRPTRDFKAPASECYKCGRWVQPHETTVAGIDVTGHYTHCNFDSWEQVWPGYVLRTPGRRHRRSA